MFNKFKNTNLKNLHLNEAYFFYFVLLINILLLFFTKFYPSMDGPAHLYNSNLIDHLLFGNKPLSEFYTINTIVIPNWVSHFLLSLFHLFLPGWLAEKMLLVLYILGISITFRLLIKELNPQNLSLSILIFPFAYSFLFHLGFYNYSVSFIVFFGTLYFWLKNRESSRITTYLVLFSLLTAIYFCNVLLYAFLGLTICFYNIYFSFENYCLHKSIKLFIKECYKKLFVWFIISLPSLILLVIFYKTVAFFPADQKYGIKELIRWLNDVRALIVYDYNGEQLLTAQFLHVLIAISLLGIFLRFKEKVNKKFEIIKSDIMLIPILIALTLFFITPSGSGAGMMSDRYCYMIFIFALIWVITQPIPKSVGQLAVLFVLVVHFGLQMKHMNGSIRNLDKNAITIHQAANYIEKNSIVLPVNLSDNWLELHFSNYLGVDKPMIILENYEAAVGWFPIKWNANSLPNVLLSDKASVSGIRWPCNSKAKIIRKIQYVMLFGNMGKLDDAQWKELKDLLGSDFKLKYCSENKYVMIYEKTR